MRAYGPDVNLGVSHARALQLQLLRHTFVRTHSQSDDELLLACPADGTCE